MKITASKLGEWIAISRIIDVPDEYGGSTEKEVPIASRWANIYAPKSRDNVVAMSGAVIISYEVTFRMPCDIKQDDIITWGDTRMVVTDYRPLQDRKFMLVLCKSEV